MGASDLSRTGAGHDVKMDRENSHEQLQHAHRIDRLGGHMTEALIPRHIELRRVNILSVGVHAIDMSLTLDRICDLIEGGRKGCVSVTGAHGIMEAQAD